MTVLLRALVLRWLARHRLRTFLAVAAVALGVAAFLASVAVGDAISRSGASSVGALVGGADLSVEAAESGVRSEVVADVVAVPGVAAAAPLIKGWARVGGTARGRVLTIGIDPLRESDPRLRGGLTPEAAGVSPEAAFAFVSGTGAMLGAALAEELGVAAGDTVQVRGTRGELSFLVAHVTDAQQASQAARGRVMIFHIAAAQSVFGRPGQADRIDVALADGASADEVAARISAVLPSREGDAEGTHAAYYVGPPRLTDGATADVLHVTNVGLRIGAGVALLIGMFLIHHTVSVGVAERRREIGILRALGATRSQVRRVFAGEALVMGLVGSALGVALGWALAQGALQGFAASIAGAYFPAEPEQVRLDPAVALAGLVLGALVSVLAAFFPAARAAAEPPSDAIRRGPEGSPRGRTVSSRQLWAALVLALVGCLACFLPPALGTWPSYVILLSVLCAFLLTAPLILARGALLLAPALARVGGIPGRLAADDLARHPRRAALPAAALAFGLALVVQTVGTLESLSAGALTWMDEQVAGELFVSAGAPVMGMGNNTPLDEDEFERVRRVEGVGASCSLRLRLLPFRDTRILVTSLDMAGYRPMAKLRVGGMDADRAFERLQDGATCLVSENFRTIHDVGIGDAVELTGPDGPFRLEVIGSFQDFSWPRGSLLADRRVLRERLGDRLVDQVTLMFEPGADPDAVTAAIDRALGEDNDFVLTRAADLRKAARDLLQELFALAYSQVAVAFSVAFLGVLNTLWIAVVLRRRELGLLRAVGGTRGQVVASIVLQAGALGVIGSVLGVAGGLLIQWVALARFLPTDTGWQYPFVAPLGGIAAIVVLGALTSALAGVVPARVAASVPVREAIGYE